MKQKIALVTGGGSGIGRAIAIKLAEMGMHVLICGRQKQFLTETVDLIEKEKRTCESIVLDLQKDEQVERNIRQHLMKYKRIDVLVNNAGIAKFDHFLNIQPQDVWNHFRLHVGVPLQLAQIAYPFFQNAGGGHMINISSDQSLRPQSLNSIYGSSKAALNFLSRSLAIELAKIDVRVNTIALGPVETSLLRSVVGDQKIENPIGRIFQPSEIAAWIEQMIDLDLTTGSILSIDGGSTL